MKTLIDAIQQFRKDIDDSDYANLGAKGKYLTVPYRLKFVREYFGEKQSTVSCGRALSFLGFFGDEIATAEEMEQFLNKSKPKTKQQVKTQTKTITELANDWIVQMQSVAEHSKSPHYFEKNLTPIREEYKSELHLIAADPIEQLRVDTEYNKLKSQIQSRGTNVR